MSSKTYVCLFIYNRNDVVIYMLIYVGNIILRSSSNQAIERLLKQLCEEFIVKDLGDLHHFLGIEVVKKDGGVVLSQQKYVRKLLLFGCEFNNRTCLDAILASRAWRFSVTTSKFVVQHISRRIRSFKPEQSI